MNRERASDGWPLAEPADDEKMAGRCVKSREEALLSGSLSAGMGFFSESLTVGAHDDRGLWKQGVETCRERRGPGVVHEVSW